MARTLISSLLLALTLAACQPSSDDGSTTNTAPAPQTASKTPVSPLAQNLPAPGMRAQLSNAIEALIAGPGSYTRIAPRNQRVGYHYLSDGNTESEYRVVLILPLGIHGGLHRINAANPLDVGDRITAQLESKTAGAFSYHTEGQLMLEQFTVQTDGGIIASGTFDFHSDNAAGQRVHIVGNFNITHPSAMAGSSTATNG